MEGIGTGFMNTGLNSVFRILFKGIYYPKTGIYKLFPKEWKQNDTPKEPKQDDAPKEPNRDEKKFRAKFLLEFYGGMFGLSILYHIH